MGKLGKDVKDLILGNDGSANEPSDFKTELQKAINAGLISKSDGTLLITSRMNADKLADLITKTQEKDVIRAAKDDGKDFDNLEEALEDKKEKEKKEEERKRKERELMAANEAMKQQEEATKKQNNPKKKKPVGGTSRKVNDEQVKQELFETGKEKEFGDNN